MSLRIQRTWLMLRAVPKVSPLHVVAGVSLAGVTLMATSGAASSSASRLRVVAACIAASVGFVVDDDAASTIDSVPATRRARRVARIAVAVVVAGVGYLLAALVADARSGMGAPRWGAVAEFATIGAVALAATALAIGRTDDGRGGRAGGAFALLLFCSVYLPPRWWVPLTARPETTRLLAITGTSLAVWLVATADPARQQPRSCVVLGRIAAQTNTRTRSTGASARGGPPTRSRRRARTGRERRRR